MDIAPKGSGRVHIAIKGVLVFFGLGMLFLGIVFMIAGGSAENYGIAVVLIIIAMVLLLIVYRASSQETAAMASQPQYHEHKYDVKMEGSGDFSEEKLVCPYCGAPADNKDITLVSGGLMIKCQYCGKASQMEEAPKW
ncbi:MAG: hypothetical protein GWN12_13670 [Thermoplasmata archaeon]|nr:hypothetical protein [Thermoplasmata archaeon]NIW89786.1 hypothetical protein [Thermoplasmata archaeon]